jgi:Domain of unknown function DUF11
LPTGTTAKATFTSADGIVSSGHELDNEGVFKAAVSGSDTLSVWVNSSSLNYGTYTVTGAGQSLGNINGSGEVINEPGATFTMAAGSSGVDTITVPMTNNKGGTLDVASGTLNLGSLTNDGSIDVGLQILQVTAALTSSSTGTLAITLASSGHGSVQVTGKTTLGGALDLTTTAGYLPPLGAKVVVVTSGSQTGKFSSETGRAIATSNTAWNVSTKAPNVSLTVANQADVTGTIAAPASAIASVPFNVTMPVTNKGPEPATKATVTLTLAQNVTVAGTLPTGCTQINSTSVKCSAGTLANGADMTFSVSVVASAADEAVFKVAAATSAADLVSSDNTQKATVKVT